MNNPRINGLRSIELAVHDLKKSADFYRKVWALEDVAGEGDTLHLRGTGRDHHVLTLRERPRAALLGVHLSAPDRATVDALHAQAVALGAKVGARAEGCCEKSAGGGYGFRVSSPEGHPIAISADVADHAERDRRRARGRPSSPTSCINSAEVEKQTAVLPRRARLQVERQHDDDGFRALLLGPSQRRDRARQRAVASTTWPTRCRTSTA